MSHTLIRLLLSLHACVVVVEQTLVLTCTPLRPLGYHRLCSQGPRWEGLRHLYLGQTW